MEPSKRFSMIFLTVINIMNLAAGVITQFKILLNKDVTSIIPIRIELTVNQILLLNFMSVAVIILLISIISSYLLTDIPYSLSEIISNCPMVFMIIPIILLFVGIFNTINAELTADKITILVCTILYTLFNVVNFGCFATVKYDAEN